MYKILKCIPLQLPFQISGSYFFKSIPIRANKKYIQQIIQITKVYFWWIIRYFNVYLLIVMIILVVLLEIFFMISFATSIYFLIVTPLNSPLCFILTSLAFHFLTLMSTISIHQGYVLLRTSQALRSKELLRYFLVM